LAHEQGDADGGRGDDSVYNDWGNKRNLLHAVMEAAVADLP
jgi:hypothetical protein